MKSAPRMSTEDLARATAEMIENGNLLNPEMPLPVLAERLFSEADREYISEMGRSLIIARFIQLLRVERRKLLPGRPEQLAMFPHAPLNIIGKRGKKVQLLDSTWEDLQRCIWRLTREKKERVKDDPKIADLKALMERVKRAALKNRGITVREVLGIE